MNGVRIVIVPSIWDKIKNELTRTQYSTEQQAIDELSKAFNDNNIEFQIEDAIGVGKRFLNNLGGEMAKIVKN